MATTQKLVLKDPAQNFTKELGNKATVKDVIKYSKDHDDAEIIIEEEGEKKDPLKPLNIKVVQLTGVGKKKAASNAASLSGIIISFDRPSDWSGELKYQVRLYDKSTKSFDKEAALVNIAIGDDLANAEYELSGCSKELAYYYFETAMSVSEDNYKKNKLVQVRRAKDEKTWSEWGTELHTDITVGGTITIFKRPLELSYKTGDENVGLKPGQEIKVNYSDILDENFAKGFPKRIFDDKPETSLMGMSVKVAKLNYNTRTKNFQLAVNVSTADIDIKDGDDKSLLEYYKKAYENKTATTVPAEDAAAIKKLKANGIELLPGFSIKEIYFELNTNDDSPKISG